MRARASLPYTACDCRSSKTLAYVSISDGHADLPSGPGLGTRLREDLFTPDHPGYRITRL